VIRIIDVIHQDKPQYWLDGPRRPPNYGPSPCGEVQLTTFMPCTLRGPDDDKIGDQIDKNDQIDDKIRIVSLRGRTREQIMHLVQGAIMLKAQRERAASFKRNKMRLRQQARRVAEVAIHGLRDRAIMDSFWRI
jgi:hypothetical protein